MIGERWGADWEEYGRGMEEGYWNSDIFFENTGDSIQETGAVSHFDLNILILKVTYWCGDGVDEFQNNDTL